MLRRVFVAGVVAAWAARARAQDSDRGGAFLRRVARMFRFELHASELAVQKAEDHRVRAFADALARDQLRDEAELRRLAQARGVDLGDGMTRMDQSRFDQLRKLTSRYFDNAYVAAMRDATARISHMLSEANAGGDPALAQFLEQVRPAAARYAQDARNLPLHKA